MVRKPKIVSWRAKLTPSQVRVIRRMAVEGYSQVWLADCFKVSQATISNLLLGKTYRKVA